MAKLREEQEKLEMAMAQQESTIKTQGNQLISSDIRSKSLTMQLTVETSSKETLQETLKAKDTHIEGLEEKVTTTTRLCQPCSPSKNIMTDFISHHLAS